MTATFHLNIQDLSGDLIRELQEKYPGSQVEVNVRRTGQPQHITEDLFWELIALLDWAKEDDDDAVVQPLVERLASLPVHFIYGFQDMLSEKLFALDGQRHAAQIGEDAYAPGKFFSVDNFLYARCCVIANGRAAYEQVLAQPETMPKDLTFEALLSVAPKAYRAKTGKPFQYLPAFNYETFSNEAAWGGLDQ